MPLQPSLPDFAFVPWLGLGTARLLRGQLLAEADRHEEAVRWLEAARRRLAELVEAGRGS
jgi:hypothetical protein